MTLSSSPTYVTGGIHVVDSRQAEMTTGCFMFHVSCSMIISLSGSAGSGKSTVAEKLTKKLKFTRYYAGGIRREEAKRRGLTLTEFNTWSETHKEGDTIVDDFWRKLAKQTPKPNIIAEGRTAFYFIPQSLKIYLYVSPKEGARRIWGSLKRQKSNRNEDTNLNSLADVMASLKEREESDRRRYQKYYGLSLADPKQYDLYLDVTRMDPNEEFATVHKFVKRALDAKLKA